MRKLDVNNPREPAHTEDLSSKNAVSQSNSDPFDRSDSELSGMRLLGLLPYLEERIELRIPSELRHLDGVLDYLNERMLKLGIVKPDDSEVMIALDEAIVNAVKHGNQCDPRKAVHIVAEFSAEGARFTVSDEGPGFTREDVPDPTDPCRLLEPSGRGLLLINHIMDEVCFNQRGNRLEMFKRSFGKTCVHSSEVPGETEAE